MFVSVYKWIFGAMEKIIAKVMYGINQELSPKNSPQNDRNQHKKR